MVTRRLVGTVATQRQNDPDPLPAWEGCDMCPHSWGPHRIWAVKDHVEIDCPLCDCRKVVRFTPELVLEEYGPTEPEPGP
jgi:hypothetical protein